MKRQDMITQLQRDEKSDPGGEIACIIWCADDVIQQADEAHDEHLSKRHANNIIGRVSQKADCGNGITWDTLDVYIEEFIEGLGEECQLCGADVVDGSRFCSEKCEEEYKES
jgi:hypothetical protein